MKNIIKRIIDSIKEFPKSVSFLAIILGISLAFLIANPITNLIFGKSFYGRNFFYQFLFMIFCVMLFSSIIFIIVINLMKNIWFSKQTNAIYRIVTTMKTTRFSNMRLFFVLIITFLISLRINTAWIYNVALSADQWAYFGTFLNPIHMRLVYSSHPIGDLLPLILPAGIFYHFLSPFLANFFFKMTCFVVTGFFSFKTLRMEFGRNTAIIGTIAFLSSQNLLFAIGTDYPQGVVMIYFLCSIYFILRAADQDTKQPTIPLLFVGFFFSMAVSTAFLSLVLITVLGTLFIGKILQQTGRLNLGECVRSGILFLVGFLIGILLLCSLHYSYTGQFVFFGNTLQKAKYFLTIHPHSKSFSLSMSWLIVPFCTCLAGLVFVLKQKILRKMDFKEILQDRGLLMVLGLVVGLCALAYVEFVRKTGTLSDPFYFNQTLPITFLAFSGMFFVFSEKMRPRIFTCVATFFAAASFLLFWWTTSSTYSPAAFATFYHSLPLYHYPLFFLLLLGIVALINKNNFSTVVFIGLFLIINITPPSHRSIRHIETIPSQRFTLELTADWVNLMNQLDPERQAYLWYDQAGNEIQLQSFASASHYCQGRVYNESFPAVNVVFGEMGIINPVDLINKEVLILTASENLISVAENNLAAMNISLTCRKVADFRSATDLYFSIYSCSFKE